MCNDSEPQLMWVSNKKMDIKRKRWRREHHTVAAAAASALGFPAFGAASVAPLLQTEHGVIFLSRLVNLESSYFFPLMQSVPWDRGWGS